MAKEGHLVDEAKKAGAVVVPRVGEVAPPPPIEDWVPANNILDTELVIHSVSFEDGEFSEFALMRTTRVSDSEEKCISCGATAVMSQLRILVAKDAFPVCAKIVKDGRRLRLE